VPPESADGTTPLLPGTRPICRLRCGEHGIAWHTMACHGMAYNDIAEHGGGATMWPYAMMC
jgi:hypothetical protein